MARQPRIQYEGAFYHVMARGDRREAIVNTEGDRLDFVVTMARACERAGWRIHAWVLMSNHYHWLLETPRANLVDGMRWFQNTYTRRFNVRNHLWGHVFGGRYKAVVLDATDGDGYYFERLLDYIHLNPVRAGLVDVIQGRGLIDYKWSSLSRAYAVDSEDRPAWMDVSRGLGVKELSDSVDGRREFVTILENRVRSEHEQAGIADAQNQTLQSTLRRGWYWGSQAFKEKLLASNREVAGERNRDYRLSQQGHERSEDVAETIVSTALGEVHLPDSELPALPGNDFRKVAIALRLQQETTVSQSWIARRLHMRSPGNVSQQLSRLRKISESSQN